MLRCSCEAVVEQERAREQAFSWGFTLRVFQLGGWSWLIAIEVLQLKFRVLESCQSGMWEHPWLEIHKMKN